uniref:Pleckstrin homology domain containing, family O member 1a n=1 Tax=Seriola dumerili TaxID=41447 RepID=A0A3B4T7C7_SERDU
RMKKSTQSRRGVQDSGQPAVQQPEKVGWIRKFCGRGIFRELWRNRYVVLRGDHLFISDKEVKDERKAQEVFDLADYERSEELRKAKSRSKKNHSRFTVLRCRQPGNTVPNLVFLAVSPEEKESWVNALNAAIIKAKNRVLDEVTIEEDSALVHPTRDRAKIPHGRRLPTRGHLMAVASTSSHGTLTLDLVAEEDGFSLDYDDDSQESWENSFRVDLQRGDFCGQVAVVGSRGVGGRQRAGTDVSKLRVVSKEPKVKTGSLPRGRSDSPCGSEAGSPRLGSSKESPCPSQKNSPSFSGSFESKTPDKHCLSPALPASPPSLLSEEDLDVERRRAEAERLLEEAVSSWKEAQEVLQEVKELQSQTLRRQRRRTYEKMTSTTAVAAAADEDDTPASPTSPEEDDESETP